MNKKFLTIMSLALGTAIATCGFVGCGDGQGSDVGGDYASAYCSQFYSADYGNYGSFTLSAMSGDVFESDFSDLSKFTLGEAFSGMTITSAVYSSDSNEVTFAIEGQLADGDCGKISGSGIVKGKEVEVSIPISPAQAYSNDVVYSNQTSQEIEIDLLSACFQKELDVNYFTLGGAAEGMVIEKVSTETYFDEETEEEYLSQTATLTLSGNLGMGSYVYITLSSEATTYNKDLSLVLSAENLGGVILNDAIETNQLYDVVYVSAENITFKQNIQKSDITLGGALKDYAQIDKVEVVNDGLVALYLNFPYTFFGGVSDENGTQTVSGTAGIISFTANTNNEGVAFNCSALVASPRVSCSVSKDGNAITLSLNLDYGEFNDLDFYPFSLLDGNGEELSATGIDIINIDNELTITFTLPEGYSGMLTFVLENAYDITNTDGAKESITIKTPLYI